MDKEKTAFKHPNCGGIIRQFDQNGKRIFECALCGMSAYDIEQLILRGLVIIRRSSRSAPSSDQSLADTDPSAEQVK